MFQLDDNKKIGIGLCSFGVLFLVLGILLFFDRALLAMGNLLFVSGTCLIIGLQKTVKFFSKPARLPGTGLFFGGILMVLLGWTFFGSIIEGIGFFRLFGNFFPMALRFGRNLPVLSNILRLPGISMVVDRIVDSGRGGLPM